MSRIKCPFPIFDNISHIKECANYVTLDAKGFPKDYKHAIEFLKSYTGSEGTFTSYRREIERLLHWSWLKAEKSIKDLRRSDLEEFIKFCHKPPKSWIGTKILARFVERGGQRQPNPRWRPFVVKVAKSAHTKGEKPQVEEYALSQGATREMFAILGTFFNYLLIEEYAMQNPVTLIRQKSKFIRKKQGKPKIRRLSQRQWDYVLRVTEELAEKNPDRHQRTLFILTALYQMYLRISELVASPRWTPTMNDFFEDNEGLWWFQTIGKGNKERQIAVSDVMLNALKKWREHLNLTPLPSTADKSPLIPKQLGKGAISDTTPVRKLVQQCFDLATEKLRQDKFITDADNLGEATVHWLRHTGISDDVKRRPREHVRDDAGHSSSAITDKYIDVELRERHKSAKNKSQIKKGHFYED